MPAGPWALPALAGLVLCAALGVGAELGWRALGHLPTASGEDLDLWAAERRRASTGSTDVIVVLGKSRAWLDLHLPTLRARFPGHRVVQLALRGRGAFATFEDLARDEDFRGKILWSLTEPDLAAVEAGGQAPAVMRAREIGPAALLDARLRAELASRLVVRSTDLAPARVIKNLAHGRTPTPQFILAKPDRFGWADFDRIDVEMIRSQVEQVQKRAMARMGGGRLDPAAWLDDARRIEPLVGALRARGGDLALLHLPVSGSSLMFSMRFYPKQAFWDRLARELDVVTVHFRDHRALKSFSCPDTSHLDKDDAPAFTGALLDELSHQGFFGSGAGPR